MEILYLNDCEKLVTNSHSLKTSDRPKSFTAWISLRKLEGFVM